ncbi:otolin-1-A [Alosa pseudoharengus]|uniref:otolin-1-A n=1 Tax=Alosa pseudoharengus TaxID=34774 RepID=UPI003F89BE84
MALLTALMATQASAARTTRWPKPKHTKKPPRGGSGPVQGVPPRLGLHQASTTTPSPSSTTGTEETTESMMDGYSSSPTDSTTYSSDAYSADYHTEAMVPAGVGLENYTLDYNECFFNFCECCPPEKGPPGPVGERGLPGPPGEKGEKGPMGLAGPAGLPGTPGLVGSKGEKGDRGEAGIPGSLGIPGRPGDKGDPGTRGSNGDTGPPGMKGDPGEKGDRGEGGFKGEKGDPGLVGMMGAPGLDGMKGERGETGDCLPGEKGDQGETGPPGPKGEAGPPGQNGTHGPPGADGEKGDAGAPGVKGDTGPVGPPGPPGGRGVPGLKGARGPKGPRGQRGVKGAKGEGAVQSRSAFSVGLFPSRSFPPPGLPVKFDKVFYNDEGHWDAATSKFNCTLPGVYVFSYHITVRNRPLRAALVVNGMRKLRTRDSLYGQDIDQASNMALFRLDPGDEVWLETLRDWNGVYSSSEDDSTFSGFLLYADVKD